MGCICSLTVAGASFTTTGCLAGRFVVCCVTRCAGTAANVGIIRGVVVRVVGVAFVVYLNEIFF